MLACTTLLLCAVAADLPDAAGIMAKVAENVESAVDARRQYVYRETVRSSMVRTNGVPARKEFREYSVTPTEKTTEKKLLTFSGQYRKGKKMIDYTEPGYKYKDLDLDGELISELTDDLVNEKDSRDGIPKDLFPLRTADLPKYEFTYMGETTYAGRRTYKVGFEPRRKSNCVTIGTDEEGCDGGAWKGEAWIDAEEFQPVRIATDLAFKIPWAVRAFLGTNLKQTGFSITYRRVAQNVWFPATYGTEFRLDVLWGYKRVITLSLQSEEFQRADAVSTVKYELP